MGAFILPPGRLSPDVSPQPGSRKPWCSLEDERRQLQMNECMKPENDADRSGICMLPSCGFLLFCLGQITVCGRMWSQKAALDVKGQGCRRARSRYILKTLILLFSFFLPPSASSASRLWLHDSGQNYSLTISVYF